MRTFLDGRFENSVFVVLAPNGQDWLTRASRGPQMVLGRSGAVTQMERIALQYPAKADLSEAIVQDFHGFRQALNVASADQRVLVLVHTTAEREPELRESLKVIANDERILGRFHFDFEQSDAWTKSIRGAKKKPGIVLINPGEFGMTGEAMQHLPLDSKTDALVTAMIRANEHFAATTEKKVYSKHVDKGRSEGVYFEGAVPYGEDRDGDGQIDRGRRSSRRR